MVPRRLHALTEDPHGGGARRCAGPHPLLADARRSAGGIQPPRPGLIPRSAHYTSAPYHFPLTHVCFRFCRSRCSQ